MIQSRKFTIDAGAQQKLNVLCDKVLQIIEDFKQRMVANAASSSSPQAYMQELRRYINKQRDQRLFVGSVRAIDHKLDELRDFRVYLSATTGAGGYFDDYLTADFLEYIKLLADERGIDAAARKHRLKKSIVQYAYETPVKDLRDLRGRGDIVLSINEISHANPRPRIMDLLTHELTHGVQMLAPSSEEYNKAITKIHQGEELTRDERHAYYRERTEFEAQLNGMLARIRTKYRALEDRDAALKALMDQLNMEEFDEDQISSQIDEYINEQKRKYKDSYNTNLINLPKKTAREIDENINQVERRFIELQNDIRHNGDQLDMIDQQLDDIIAQAHTAKQQCLRGNEEACSRHKDLKPVYDKLTNERDSLYDTNVKLHDKMHQMRAKYHVFASASRDFIASIAGDKQLWDEFKRAIREFINSLD